MAKQHAAGDIVADISKKVRIRDVAEAAGVSYASAQYVLSGKSSARISDAVRARILDVAARMGYKLDVIGAALKRGYLDMIIIVVSGTRIRGGTVDLFMELTRNSTVANLPTAVYVAGSLQETIEMFQRAVDLQPYGLFVMWEAVDVAESYILSAMKSGIPVISLYPYGGTEIVSVTTDRTQAFSDSVVYLAGLGHRKIAFLAGSDLMGATTRAKFAGYKRGLELSGIACEASLVQSSSETSYYGGAESMGALFGRRPDTTAVVAVNDQLAIGAMQAAQDKGLVIGKDLSVIGWGASEEGGVSRPALTTMKDDPVEIAHHAVVELTKMRLHPLLPSVSHYIPTELVIRESTGPAPTPIT